MFGRCESAVWSTIKALLVQMQVLLKGVAAQASDYRQASPRWESEVSYSLSGGCERVNLRLSLDKTQTTEQQGVTMSVYILRDAFSHKFRIQRKFHSDKGVAKLFSLFRSSSLHLFEVIDVDREEACESTLKRQLSTCEFFCALPDDCFLLDPILVLRTVCDVRRRFAGPERSGKPVLDGANKVSKGALIGQTVEDEDFGFPVRANRELVFLRSNASYWTICLNHSLESVEWASAAD
jgi:hypothetical protein